MLFEYFSEPTNRPHSLGVMFGKRYSRWIFSYEAEYLHGMPIDQLCNCSTIRKRWEMESWNSLLNGIFFLECRKLVEISLLIWVETYNVRLSHHSNLEFTLQIIRLLILHVHSLNWETMVNNSIIYIEFNIPHMWMPNCENEYDDLTM